MQPEEIQALVKKYLDGTITPEEKQLLDKWYLDGQKNSAEWFAEAADEEDVLRREIFQKIRNRIGIQSRKQIKRLWPHIAVAASVLIAISIGSYVVLQNQRIQENAQLIKNDISPAHNRATLTLANGQQIVLTKGLNGMLATQGTTLIQAIHNSIIYNNAQTTDQVNYNTLSTAKGEQSPYPLVLADGTKIWLNAQSSITFPTVFNGRERIVKLVGEAYFEVRHNARQPFKVQTATQTIEDIGTAFNVNAYNDEPAIETTLIEGSVKVNALTLRPGEQTDGTKVADVSTAQYTAWKNGDFYFNNDHITTIMRQLSRWYSIDVAYEGSVSKDRFNAVISRNKNISVILHALERTKGVHFKIEGRRVTVIR